MAYRITEHTADIGIAADGVDIGEALAQAGLALSEVVLGGPPHTLRPDGEVIFEVQAPDDESLVVAFLAELLWILEEKETLWLGGGVAVRPGDEGPVAAARGNGRRIGGSARGVEVKAVTYHDLVAQARRGRFHIEVLLDI